MKMYKRLIALAIALAIMVSMIPTSFAKESGSCGKNVKWSYDEKTDTLTISGKGAMKNNYTPWYSFIDEDYDCDGVNIVVKEGVTEIGDGAFEEIFIKSISLPKSLKKIGKSVFGVASVSCSRGLKTVTIPKNLESVGKGSLDRLDVKEFKVASGNKYFSAKDGVLFNKKKTTLVRYPADKKATSYTIPKTVKTLSYGAFACCGNLKKLTIPASVKTIKASNFRWCSISKFYFKGNAPKIDNGEFEEISCTIYYPKKKAKSWKKYKGKDFWADEIVWKTWKG